MKITKRIIIGILFILAIIAIAVFIFLQNLKNAAVPDYNKNVTINELSDSVTVYRDGYGIPHVYANNESDLYRAVGFLMAQDRLWQMDLLRRVTQGRLSEIFGKDQVKTDLLMRALRIEEKSKKILEQASPEIRSALQSFSEGVNYYMAFCPLPPEFKILGYRPDPWEPIHSINLIGYMSWDLNSGWSLELLLQKISKEVDSAQVNDVIPRMKNHKTTVYPDFLRK